MNLSTFIYVVLIMSIPYFWYIRYSTNPKKGFSILFIGVISVILIINFNAFVLIGFLLIASVLFHSNVSLANFSIFLSFTVLIYELFNSIEENLIMNILPITLVSGVFALMMIGHWFLVDPTISREGMKNIAKSSIFISILICLFLLTGLFSNDISDFYRNIIIGLYVSSGILSLGSLKSLNEKSYTGVMAATGLSYLSLLVSLGGTGTLILLP